MRICLELSALTPFYRSRATTAAPMLVSCMALAYLDTDEELQIGQTSLYISDRNVSGRWSEAQQSC